MPSRSPAFIVLPFFLTTVTNKIAYPQISLSHPDKASDLFLTTAKLLPVQVMANAMCLNDGPNCEAKHRPTFNS